MIRLLQTKWMAVTACTLAFAITIWVCLQPKKQIADTVAKVHSLQAAQRAIGTGPSWTFYNPEMSQLVAELKDEREALRVRASQMEVLEARLHAERKEIYGITQAVNQLRAEFDTVVTRVGAEESANLRKLAKVYATMTPEGGGRILKEMEDGQIVKILALMKESESAPLLESLGQGNKADARRAAIISNRLRLTLSSTKKPGAP